MAKKQKARKPRKPRGPKVTGDTLKSRMVRVDARFADLVTRSAKQNGVHTTAFTRTLAKQYGSQMIGAINVALVEIEEGNHEETSG